MNSNHPRPTALRAQLRARLVPLITELRVNQRLQLGLAGIAIMLLVTGLLKLDDLRVAERKQVEAIYADNLQLRKRMGGEDRQQWLQERLSAARTQIAQSHWQVSSPMMAQTLFGDWLANELADAGAKDVKVSQPTTRHISDHGQASTSSTADCDSHACELLELRSTVRFLFEPDHATRIIARIEQAEWPLKLDQLVIRVGERRVELTVKALARLNESAVTKSDAAVPSAPSDAISAEMIPAPPPTSDGPPAPPKIEKVIEIKW